MKKILTFIINLKESAERREYMKNVLSGFDFLDIEFIEAVNGNALTVKELESVFNQNRAFVQYGRVLRGGEVGCSLSHLKCAQALLDSGEDVALVLEDDLVIQDNEIAVLLEKINDYLSSSGPAIILFSGDYWFWGKKPFEGKYQLASVREAVCSQAYMINRAGAEKMIEMGPYHLSDDWFAIKKAGIELSALYPHIADQNRLDLDTVISPEYTGFIRKNLSIGRRIHSYYRAVVKRILKYTGHFEYKRFKW
jgi:glycosyl transferase family 25